MFFFFFLLIFLWPEYKASVENVSQASSLVLSVWSHLDLIRTHKDFEAARLTQNMLISKRKNQTSSCCELLWHFQGQCTQFSILSTNRGWQHPPSLWRMHPQIPAITPPLLYLPSICVTSKRPYQCCWCRSRKCTSLLPISEAAK